MATPEFTTASLQGTYALTGTGRGGRAPIASIGTLSFDGNGNSSGLLLQSVPGGNFMERNLIPIPFAGTYQFDSNGIVTTLSMNGEFETRLAITRAERANDSMIAQEFSLVAKQLEPTTGSLITAVASRLPDEGEFTKASLKGTYIGTAIGQGGQTAGAGFGIIRYDGNGRFTETNLVNVQGDSLSERRFVTGSDEGNYTVNADGTGTVAEGGVVFAITRAVLSNGFKVALEYSFIVRDLIPTTGNLFTGVTRRISD